MNVVTASAVNGVSPPIKRNSFHLGTLTERRSAENLRYDRSDRRNLQTVIEF